MRSEKQKHAAFVAAIVLTCASSSTARAEDPAPPRALGSVERAELLFNRAMELAADGRVGEACPMFVQSLRLDPAMGTRYRLAECYEKTNRREAAYRLYREVTDEARREGMHDRENLSRLRSEALSAVLARLVVWVPPEVRETPELRVTLDGTTLDRAAWTGEALPVDLGEHVLEAMAPGRKPYRRIVPVIDTFVPVEVSVPSLRSEVDAPLEPRPVETTNPDAGQQGADTSARPAAALVLGLGGAGAFIAGVGIGGVALATGGLSESTRTTAAVGVGLGGLGIVAAGVWWLVTPSTKRAGGVSSAILPSVGPLGGGLSVVGRF